MKIIYCDSFYFRLPVAQIESLWRERVLHFRGVRREKKCRAERNKASDVTSAAPRKTFTQFHFRCVWFASVQSWFFNFVTSPRERTTVELCNRAFRGACGSDRKYFSWTLFQIWWFKACTKIWLIFDFSASLFILLLFTIIFILFTLLLVANKILLSKLQKFICIDTVFQHTPKSLHFSVVFSSFFKLFSCLYEAETESECMPPNEQKLTIVMCILRRTSYRSKKRRETRTTKSLFNKLCITKYPLQRILRKAQAANPEKFKCCYCAYSCFTAHNQHRLPTHQPVIDRSTPSRCHVSAKTSSIFSPTRLRSHFEPNQRRWRVVKSEFMWHQTASRRKERKNPFFYTNFRH